jgi:uncharacterized OB-fold protein
VSEPTESVDVSAEGLRLSSAGDSWRESLASDRFLIQVCGRCGTARWYHRAACPACGSVTADDVASGADGRIISLTRVAVNAEPEFHGQAPYTLAFIQLDEGPSLIARMSEGAATCSIGDPVTADWPAADHHVPRFKLRSESAGRPLPR